MHAFQKVFYGAKDEKAGSCGSIINLFELPYNHKPELIGGIMEEECSNILKEFFQALRLKRQLSQNGNRLKTKKEDMQCLHILLLFYHDYFMFLKKFIPINIIQLCFRRCPGMFVHILFLLWFFFGNLFFKGISAFWFYCSCLFLMVIRFCIRCSFHMFINKLGVNKESNSQNTQTNSNTTPK